MHDARGQATVDYLAVVLVVAAVLAAVAGVAAATGLGGRVVAALRRALCVVTGGACDEVAPAPCVRASSRHTQGGEIDALVLRLGRRQTELREHRADGTVAVTLVDSGAAGLQAGAGAEAHVRWGPYGWAAGAELRAAIMAERSSGRSWVVHDDAAASRLVDRVRASGLAPPHSLAARPQVPMRLPVAPPPPPTATFSDHGAELALDAIAPAGGAQLHLAAQSAYGERLDRASGRRTYYVRDVRAGRASVALARFGAGGAGEADERYGLTYDRAGRPVDFEALSSLDVAGGAALPPALAAIAGLLALSTHGATHVETEQHLDLTEPGNALVARRYLAALGHDGAGLRLDAALLRNRLAAFGTASVRTYATTSSAHEVGAHARAGPFGVGAEGGSEDLSTRLLAAAVRAPGGRWRPDPSCRG